MGEADRYLDYKHNRNRKRFTLGQDNNALFALVTVNVTFFLILLTMQVGYSFYEKTPQLYQQEVVSWFALPARFGTLSERPWTILTYMFSDTGAALIRLISNMIWLWVFGKILQALAGNDKIIPIYLYGGVLGGLFFIIAHYMASPVQQQISQMPLLGANAAVMSVATATTVLSPDYRFFTHIRKGVPLWVLLAIYIMIDFAGLASAHSAVSLSHLGGVLAGVLFVIFLRRGIDGSLWMNRFYERAINLFTPQKKEDPAALREKVFYETGNRKPFDKKTYNTQKRLDEILDKINEKGYHFLTEEEKQFLINASKEDN